MERDPAEAVNWFHKAARQGDIYGQYNLGFMNFMVRGMAQDYALAMTWYQKSAAGGYARAQYNLGVMYDEGQGVSRDLIQSYEWCSIADGNGIRSAGRNKAKIAAKMTPAEISKAKTLADEWGARHTR